MIEVDVFCVEGQVTLLALCTIFTWILVEIRRLKIERDKAYHQKKLEEKRLEIEKARLEQLEREKAEEYSRIVAQNRALNFWRY